RDEDEEAMPAAPAASMGYSPTQIQNSIMEKISAKCKIQKPAVPEGHSHDDLMIRLNLIKKYI
ncbi:MAG: hypothetical protein LUE31_11455, partial [Lachnospiraceae bacterium]|nr:hypothetical protein [Lachnospiraceae bacterium]